MSQTRYVRIDSEAPADRWPELILEQFEAPAPASISKIHCEELTFMRPFLISTLVLLALAVLPAPRARSRQCWPT